MKETRTAQRYAKALFELAIERESLGQAYNDMCLVDSVCNASREFRTMLASPVISKARKKQIFRAVFGDKISRLSLDFLLLIATKGREAVIIPIANEFIALYKEHMGIVTVHLKTAAALDEATRKLLLDRMAGLVKAEIELVEEVDPRLIGGFVLLFDNNKLDLSILNQIEKLKKEFQINPFVREF